MKEIGKYVYLFIIAIILLTPCYSEAARGVGVRPLSPAGAEVTGNQWLFVIGIDTYIDWPRLTTAVSDAKAVRDVLLSRYHFDEDHVVELYDEQATRKNILKRLRYLAKKVGPEDSLVVFYAGHGHLDSLTKEGSWIPVESGTKDVSAWISNHDIKNYLRVDAIKAKHILLISDSCFSGDFFRGHRGKLPEVTDEVIKRAYKLTSRQAITSGGLEPVADEGFGNNSVFSHFLVKTLKENEKPFLVPSDFYRDIKAGVAENAQQFPQFGSLKDTGGQQGGELVLFLKQDSRLQALSAEAAERQTELEHLRQMEAAAEQARRKEAEEIAARERELAQLDAQIARMRKRLGTPGAARSDESLNAMVAMVEQKQDQQRRLQGLKRRREEQERHRRRELIELEWEKWKQQEVVFKEDLRKYEMIAHSRFGATMKEIAWKELTSNYPLAAQGLEVGNTEALRDNYLATGCGNNPLRWLYYASGSARAIGAAKDKVRACTDTAKLQIEAGDIPGARETLGIAKSAAGGLGDKSDEAYAYQDIAKVLARAGDVPGAKAIAGAIETEVRIQAYRYIAVAQAEAGDIAGAKSTANALKETTFNHKSQAFRGIAKAQAKGGDIAGAKTTSTMIGNVDQRNWTNVDIAIAQAEAGDIAGAKSTVKILNDARRKFFAFKHIAKAQAKGGDIAGAKTTAQMLQEPTDKLGVYYDIGKSQAEFGDLIGVRETLRIAESIAQSITDPADRSKGYLTIARIQMSIGDIAEARKSLKMAKSIAARVSSKWIREWVYKDIASTQAETGDIAGAEATLAIISEKLYRRLTYQNIARARAKRDGPESVEGWLKQNNVPLLRTYISLGAAEAFLL